MAEDQGELLTRPERLAMDVTAELWNLLCEVVGNGPCRAGDLRELALHIHNIQHAILAQAAARAYPRRFRLLGLDLSQEGPRT